MNAVDKKVLRLMAKTLKSAIDNKANEFITRMIVNFNSILLSNDPKKIKKMYDKLEEIALSKSV